MITTVRLIILFILLSLGADAQIIRANAFYRPQPSGVTFLLDAYPNAAAAYSLRKLKSSYSGSAIRIRRDSTGNAETDIGFTANGDLDTIAIKNHCRNNNCAIVTWYDQTGNTRNATQTTASRQPIIMTSGVLEYQNGFPTIKCDGGGGVNGDYLTATNSSSLFQNIGKASIFTVVRSRNTALAFNYYALAGTTGNSRVALVSGLTTNRYSILGRRNDADAAAIINNTTAINTTNNRLQTGIFLWETSDAYQYINGSLAGSSTSWLTDGNTANTTSPTVSIGEQASQINIQEIIIYISDESSNRTGIETNINNYYGIW